MSGRDLAVLAACDHTILTYGTYGFWAGFLAGKGRGRRIVPQFFPRYVSRGTAKYFYTDHPLKTDRMSRLYFGIEEV